MGRCVALAHLPGVVAVVRHLAVAGLTGSAPEVLVHRVDRSGCERRDRTRDSVRIQGAGGRGGLVADPDVVELDDLVIEAVPTPAPAGGGHLAAADHLREGFAGAHVHALAVDLDLVLLFAPVVPRDEGDLADAVLREGTLLSVRGRAGGSSTRSAAQEGLQDEEEKGVG